MWPACVACTRINRHPSSTPTSTKCYLGAVSTIGTGAGAAAIVLNGWVQTAVAAAELVNFLEASVLYALSVAEIHGVHAGDVERRCLPAMSVLVGDAAGKKAVEPSLGRSVPYWGRAILNSIPMSTISKANKVLSPRFITKYGTKQGVLVLGKQMPMLIGVGISAAGNGAFDWFVIRSARKILGPLLKEWPSNIEASNESVSEVCIVRESDSMFDNPRETGRRRSTNECDVGNPQ